MRIINLFVKQGEHTPYRYKGTAYKRNDTSSLPVNNFELDDLVLKGTHQHFDELPANVNGKLTFSKIEQALQNQLGIKKLSPDVQISFGLVNKKHQFTNAGALLADKNDFPGIALVRLGNNINRINERITCEHVSI